MEVGAKPVGIFAIAKPRITLAAMLACAVVAIPNAAFAAGTQAGTAINNTATATYSDGTATQTVNSNQVTLNVDELLDVTVTGDDPADVATAPGAANVVSKFTVANTGNGDEAFALTAITNRTADAFDPASSAIYLDTDGDGQFNSANDALYVAGTNDPVLAPDGRIGVFIVSTMPAGATNGQRAEVALVAAARTGTGVPGRVFAGQGTGGVDAVVGLSGADADDNAFYVINAIAVALAKSAVVADPFGAAEAVPGAIITYTLTATITGTGNAQGLAIADPIPAATQYVLGSITLGGVSQTDAVDGDAGDYNGTRIAVALGNVPAGQTRTVTFRVRIP